MAIDHISVANVPYWPYLPMGMTNFGGDIQVFTIPEYASGQIGCTLNAQGLQAIQGDTTQMYNNWGCPYPNVSFSNNPFMVNMERNAEQLANNLCNQSINNCFNTINMTKQRLNALLLKDGITDNQKEKIEKLLDKLAEQEEKLIELASDTELSAAERNKKVALIEKSIRSIINEIPKIEKSSGSSRAGGSEGTDDTDRPSSERPAEDNDEDGIADRATYSDDAFLLAEHFYNATEDTWCGIPCTDDETFNTVCESINEDNVIDVMLAWKDMHSAENGESFMTTFMWDADSDQKEKYGKQIKLALMVKARELGVMDKCAADFAAIDKELNSTFYISNDVAKNYDNVIKIIAEAMKQPYDTSSFKY